MTQTDKDLLLKDLCARLPYDVKVTTNNFHNLTLLSINPNGIADVVPNNGYPMEINWGDCKPYLFPLSSMTVGQGKEFAATLKYLPAEEIDIWTLNTYDWCNKNHFDYRGLIPKGLANDATGLNIY